ncbi:MAG: MCE family protein [Nitrospirota bacterium]|nr:MCE family protein [Nitrospirota bacterium]
MDERKNTFLSLSPEAKVGLFVLFGVLLLVYMSLRVGGIKFGKAEGYTLKVQFANAAGLDKDASVRVAGVEVGRIKEITLKDSKAQLTLQMQPDIKIGKDFMAVLTTKGLLGERYLELIPGAPNAPALKDGDTITRTTSYADMDKLVTILSEVSTDIKSVSQSLSKVLGTQEGEASLQNIVKNIEEISIRLNNLIERNDTRMDQMITNLNDFSQMLKKDGPVLTTELRMAAKNLNEAIIKTSGNVNGMIDDNRESLKEGMDNLRLATIRMQEAMDSINKMAKDIGPSVSEAVNATNSIAKKIDRGEGTIGKLVNDSTMHDSINKTVSGINKYIDKAESLKMYLGYRAEYGFQSKDTKSYFSLRIQPKADKQYLVDIVSDPQGRRKKETVTTVTNGVTSTRVETTTSDTFKFSLQAAKRFWNVVVRGGIIESSGGVGTDMYLFRDRLKFTLEAFDFTRSNNKPHVKAGATVFVSKYFYLTGGYDDFMNTDKTLKTTYFGLGFQFEDEDVKYLMGSMPSVGSL